MSLKECADFQQKEIGSQILDGPIFSMIYSKGSRGLNKTTNVQTSVLKLNILGKIISHLV